MNARRRVAVLVNGSEASALGVRSRGLFEPLRARFDVTYVYRERRRVVSLATFVGAVKRIDPDLVYVIDTGLVSAGAALVARAATATPYVLDTGDLCYELARATGRYGAIGRAALRTFEQRVLHSAAAVVVRGTYHKRLLEQLGYRTVHVVRDGTFLEEVPPEDVQLRRVLGLEDALCVGTVGTIRWNRRTGRCYAWELVEALSRTHHDSNVRALIVGDGDGLAWLRARAATLAVAHCVTFVGRVPHAELPRYLSLLDVAISTQTDDPVGHVRTTGKLAEYVGAGCFVLASDVGEARLLLPQEMRLPYHGSVDEQYPERLARRLDELTRVDRATLRAAGRAAAAKMRDDVSYRELAARVESVLDAVLERA